MLEWFDSIDVRVQVALIGIIFALSTVFIKDIGLQFWLESRQQKKSALTIYRNYADPLAAAAISLFWRLRETLLYEGRGAYLKESGKENEFNAYKYLSTLYRLAAVIGWLRAYRREVTSFSLGTHPKLKPLNNSIAEFESALADGTHFEIQRLRSLTHLWDIELPGDENEIMQLAVSIEQIVRTKLHENKIDIAIDLPDLKQKELYDAIFSHLCGASYSEPTTNLIEIDLIQRAIRSLSIREAWLYRDFQAGLGDLMTSTVESGARRYEVIGFRQFESLFHSDDEDDRRWMNRLRRVFDRLDISGADQFDARLQMLENVFSATIALILELSRIDTKGGVIPRTTLAEANKLRSDTRWRKTIT